MSVEMTMYMHDTFHCTGAIKPSTIPFLHDVCTVYIFFLLHEHLSSRPTREDGLDSLHKCVRDTKTLCLSVLAAQHSLPTLYVVQLDLTIEISLVPFDSRPRSFGSFTPGEFLVQSQPFHHGPIGSQLDLGAVEHTAGELEARGLFEPPLVGHEFANAVCYFGVLVVVALLGSQGDLVDPGHSAMVGDTATTTTVHEPELPDDVSSDFSSEGVPPPPVGGPGEVPHRASHALHPPGVDEIPAGAPQQLRDLVDVRARVEQGPVVQRPSPREFVRAPADLEPFGLAMRRAPHDYVVPVVDADVARPVARGGPGRRQEGPHHHLGVRASLEGFRVGHDDRVIQVARVVENGPTSAASAHEVDRCCCPSISSLPVKVPRRAPVCGLDGFFLSLLRHQTSS